jgi:hypothetical protein
MGVFIVVAIVGLFGGGFVHQQKKLDKAHEYKMYKLCLTNAKSEETKAKCR